MERDLHQQHVSDIILNSIDEIMVFAYNTANTEAINALLKQGWTLLDVKIIEHKKCYEDGVILSEPSYSYILGRSKKMM